MHNVELRINYQTNYELNFRLKTLDLRLKKTTMTYCENCGKAIGRRRTHRLATSLVRQRLRIMGDLFSLRDSS